MNKILFISQNYPPEAGAFKYSYYLSAGLAKKGFDVTVVTGIPHYPNKTPYPGYSKFRTVKSIEGKVKVVRIPLIMGDNTQTFLRVLGFISFSINLFLRTFKFRKFDLVISSIPPFTVSWNGFILSKIFGIQWIALLRDIEPLSLLAVRNLSSKPFYKWLINSTMNIYKKSNMIVLIHKEQYKTLENYNFNPDKIKVINHCIDFSYFDNLSKNAANVRFENSNNLKGIYVGTIGAMHQLDKLILMFGDERIRELPIEIFIYGGGEFFNICKKIIEDENITKVKLLGQIEWEKTPSVLKQADFLILNLIEDKNLITGYTSKTYEYLAAGKPILVSSPSYSADLINALQCGWTFSKSNSETLFIALKTLLDKRDSLDEIGMKGKIYAEKYFNSKDFEESWYNLVDKLIKLK